MRDVEDSARVLVLISVSEGQSEAHLDSVLKIQFLGPPPQAYWVHRLGDSEGCLRLESQGGKALHNGGIGRRNWQRCGVAAHQGSRTAYRGLCPWGPSSRPTTKVPRLGPTLTLPCGAQTQVDSVALPCGGLERGGGKGRDPRQRDFPEDEGKAHTISTSPSNRPEQRGRGRSGNKDIVTIVVVLMAPPQG